MLEKVSWREKAAQSIEAGSAATRTRHAVPVIEIDEATGVPSYPDNVDGQGREMVALHIENAGDFTVIVLVPLAHLENNSNRGALLMPYKMHVGGASRVAAFVRGCNYMDREIYTVAVAVRTVHATGAKGRSFWNMRLEELPRDISADEDLMQRVDSLLPTAKKIAAALLRTSASPVRSRKF
jgi:hypothetical protein